MTELTRDLIGNTDALYTLEELAACDDHAKRLKVTCEESVNQMNFHIACNSDVHLLTAWEQLGEEDGYNYQTTAYTDK